MSKIAYITLGCPKNQVDTEMLAADLGSGNYISTDEIQEADALIINTCCFVDDAKKESIEMILQCAKEKRKDSKLVVMGCMGQKYEQEIREGIPEIDAVFGIEAGPKIMEYLDRELVLSSGNGGSNKKKSDTDIEKDDLPIGDLSDTLKHPSVPYAYVKIADGCNRGCSFCVIPSIRGAFRSLPPGTILGNVSGHLREGIKEIVLVAQDISEYGKDLKDKYTLAHLVSEICTLEGDFRLRLLYLHPKGITAELLKTIADEEKVCKYIDIPIQHSEDNMLDAMKRAHNKEFLINKIKEIREKIPDVVLRTTLIVGFPGETEDDFTSLVHFIKDASFDHLGVFQYSPQEGTPASKLRSKLRVRTKRERYDTIMRVQSEISLAKNREKLGMICPVLIDEIDGDMAIGRTCGQAPEIDGVVMISEPLGHRPGDIVHVRINEFFDYDLSAEIVNKEKELHVQ